MSIGKARQASIRLDDVTKRDVRTQFGALCWRKHRSGLQVLLVTSLTTKRWIVPKGWPTDGATPVESAMTEAWEEGGVEGAAKSTCLGIYSYDKVLDDGSRLPCVVALFPVRVKRLADDWPEKDRRKRRWFSLKKAASLVAEPELAQHIRQFSPDRY